MATISAQHIGSIYLMHVMNSITIGTSTATSTEAVHRKIHLKVKTGKKDVVREGRKKAATRFKRPSTQNLNSATVTKTYQSIPFSLIITIPRHALAMVTRPSQPHTEREKRSTKPVVGAAHHHRTLRTSLLAKRPHPTQASSPKPTQPNPKRVCTSAQRFPQTQLRIRHSCSPPKAALVAF
jgi:hypothetical protein